ncbi:MAG: TonB-dependent receptor [Chitinophagaceae bacterium]|nr:TonB-dependent receptor [Chitinophagaceae bacterium]
MSPKLLLILIIFIASSGYSQVDTGSLQEIVVTANREGVKRTETPVAITTIDAKLIKDTRAVSIDQLLNKVSGVNMVNLGNEQHQMSIRQPITTKSLFLYLQDGIPIRTSGLFNHNALLEINMASVKRIEVIKGSSSSLYGSEAIGGVVNFITLAPTDSLDCRVSLQANNIGYKRADIITSFTTGKLGIVASGYYADKKNGFLEYSDFNKGTFSVRADYKFSEDTYLSNNISYIDYYSDMPGGIDSAMFAEKKFTNPQTFTYRKVNSLRYYSTLNHEWSASGKTSISLIYRKNSIEQNPAYRIKDDYRKQNGEWRGRKDLAHGEINKSSFNSYAMIAQHRQQFHKMRAVLITGISVDISPSDYNARYIKINRDSTTKKYTGYQNMDSTLTDYSTAINNYAGYINFEFSPLNKLRVVASLRNDFFKYRFDNYLKPSSFSGAADTVNDFSRVSSKIGATYNFSNKTGVYANYSEGFIPPQVTEMYTGVKVPDLVPSVVYNYEAGGWAELIYNKLMADISIYDLKSTNEVISVRQDDGSFVNQNAGKTSHKGIEAGIRIRPVNNVSIRFSGAYSKHKFEEFREKGENYNGKEMNGAPNWIYNAEIWYTPAYIKGLRTGIELQHVGEYYTDAKNTNKYPGYTVINFRAAYEYKWMEFWINVMNATDRFYATVASKSNFGYSYTLAEPISINVGYTYNFGKLFNRK